MTTGYSAPNRSERLGFQVGGMDCASCVGKIETALGRMGGISEVAVNFTAETLALSRDADSKTTAKDIAKKIRSLGFDVTELPATAVPAAPTSHPAAHAHEGHDHSEVACLTQEEHNRQSMDTLKSEILITVEENKLEEDQANEEDIVVVDHEENHNHQEEQRSDKRILRDLTSSAGEMQCRTANAKRHQRRNRVPPVIHSTTRHEVFDSSQFDHGCNQYQQVNGNQCHVGSNDYGPVPRMFIGV